MNIQINTKGILHCRCVSANEVPEGDLERLNWVDNQYGFFKLEECWHHVEEFSFSSGELQWFATSFSTGVARLPPYDDGSFFAFNFSD